MSKNIKDSELDELINNEKIILEEGSETESQHEDMRNFDRQLKSRNNNTRAPAKNVKGPYSDDSSEEEKDEDPKVLFQMSSQPSPKKPQSKLDEIQNQIRWKEERQELDQLAKLSGEGAKDKKIRELAQRLKNLNLAYEKQRTIRRKLQEQVKSGEPPASKNNNEPSEATMKSAQDTLKTKMTNTLNTQQDEDANPQALKTKLAEADKKLMEMRVKTQNMKNELNKAMRVLAKEVGDNVNLDQLLSQQNAWKGRQQKIQKLKGRVKELEDKLNGNGINVSHMSSFTAQSNDRMSTTSNRQMNSVASLAETRRKEFENLKVQVQALKNENELLQGKVKSLTSRKLILEKEAAESKGQYDKKEKLLREKSDNDDKYIALLKQENEKLKKEERVVTKLVYRNATNETGGNSGNSEEVSALKKEIDKLNNLGIKKDTKIKSLEAEIQQLQRQLKGSTGGSAPVEIDKRVLKKKIDEVEKDASKFEKQLTPAEEEELYNRWKENKMKNLKQ